MKSIPLPVRVAAGLAATAVEQARTLPAKLAGLPVTVASQALQVSMRVQQQVTELAIRGDEVLSGLRPVEETPEWATFDEDLGDQPSTPDHRSAFDRVADEDEDRSNGFHATDPWVQEERALAEETETRELGRELDLPGADLPGAELPVAELPSADLSSVDLPAAEGYDELSLPQLRARLRRFSADQLAELLEHERAHGNRPSFVGMLTRRIATVRDSSE